MIGLSDLTDIFALFASGVGIGVIFITLFFVIGSAISFIYSLMSKA